MKGEYSLDVAIPINEAVKRVMEMPDSAAAEGTYFSGRVKRVSKSIQIYFRQVSESEIRFSDTLNWNDRYMLTGECFFKSISKYKTQVTAKFEIGTMSISIFKIVIWTFLLLISAAIPLAAWILYRLLLDTGTPESKALPLTIIAGLFILIIPVFSGLIFWSISGKIKVFLANFSKALGVGNDWI